MLGTEIVSPVTGLAPKVVEIIVVDLDGSFMEHHGVTEEVSSVISVLTKTVTVAVRNP